jgi:YVTN family beta-propeller protein
MLHLALTTLLTLQSASASPGVNQNSPGEESSAPAATPTVPRRATPTPSHPSRHTPSPSPSPTPTPRGPQGLLVVANKSDATVSILDAANGRTRATVPVEPGPHEVEVLPDGKTAAVSDYGRGGAPGRMVSFIDLTAGKVVSRVDIGEGSRPHGLKALIDGRLLVTAEGKRELVVVDTKTGKIAMRAPTGHEVSHMVAASPDARRAYVTSLRDGLVTVIDLSTGKIIQDVTTGKGAEGVDVSPDGREVWVANRGADTITVIDAHRLKVAATIHAGEFPIRVKLTPDGRRAIVSFTGSGDVGVFDASSHAEVKRIPIGREAVPGAQNRVFRKRFGSGPAPVGLLVSPDGTRAWVSATHADVVAVVDLQAFRVEDAWTAGKEPDGLAGSFAKK